MLDYIINPESLKGRVCVEGGKRLKAWVNDRRLSLNQCGKVIVPQKRELDEQLELLEKRGRENGARVSIIVSNI